MYISTRRARSGIYRSKITGLDQGMADAGSTSDKNQFTESTSSCDQHTGSTRNSDQTEPTSVKDKPMKSASGKKRTSKSYNDKMQVKKEDSDHLGVSGLDIASRLEYVPKTYQTVATSQERKKTRGRPCKYHLEWEEESGITKKYDATVVQCCLCFRNLLFGCNGQKVFKRHRHFETDNIICSSCERVSNVNTLTTNTQPSQNTYEKLQHLSESLPGAIKPVTKVVYVVRPPSDTDFDKLIIKKPRIYKKRRPNVELYPCIDGQSGSTSRTDTASSHINNGEHAFTSKTHIWTQSKLDGYQPNNDDDSDDNDSDDDDDDDDISHVDDENDDRSQKYSTAKMFVKIGKQSVLGGNVMTLQPSSAHQEMTDGSDQEPGVIENNIITEIKTEPVDPALDALHSNSQQFQKNPEIEIKIESVDPVYADFEKDSRSSEQMYQTDINVGPVVDQSRDQYVNNDLAYIYLSEQDDSSIPKSSPENDQCKSPNNCVAVVPVRDQMFIKQEVETE
ncbi:uncharacterized protein LOC117337239 isoform X2 [Pecten maximus]|uniref:uncharacterized protein LOC117337239 isoform X2 n=1 Tax=Pecten maximus TaxID=6579 RepID=UPI0014584611|nr:uncharacterized protein LOC117337239 isoform X2 [Pecten maximus]